jgi:hypothetical protein
MKVLLVSVLTLLATARCGKESAATACAGSHNGTWNGTTITDQIKLTDACAFTYSNSAFGCASVGTYGAPLSGTGSVLVTITSATGTGCLAAGSYTATYAVTDTALSFNAGAGTFSYAK